MWAVELPFTGGLAPARYHYTAERAKQWGNVLMGRQARETNPFCRTPKYAVTTARAPDSSENCHGYIPNAPTDSGTQTALPYGAGTVTSGVEGENTDLSAELREHSGWLSLNNVQRGDHRTDVTDSCGGTYNFPDNVVSTGRRRQMQQVSTLRWSFLQWSHAEYAAVEPGGTPLLQTITVYRG